MSEPCPYCGRDQEINHDDGYGYNEDEIYRQECGHCEKVFVYRTIISVDYETFRADCQNGGEHDLKPVRRFPECLGIGVMVCKVCGDEIDTKPEERKEATRKYFAEFEAKHNA